MARHYYFAEPYPDELIGSVLLRTARHRGLAGCSPVVRGQTKVSLVFSAYLAEIAAALNMPPGDLLNRHTPFPFVTAFMSQQQTDRMARVLLSSNAITISAVIHAATRGGLQPRYCPSCVEQDLTCYGESYWHQCHNLPFVVACPMHQLPLRQIKPLGYGVAIRSLPNECVGEQVTTVLDGEVTRWLESKSRECIALPARSALEGVSTSYRAAAAKKHPVPASGGFCGRSLCVGIAGFYGMPFIRKYRVGFPLSERGWPSVLAGGSTKAPQTTVKHLVLQVYLDHGDN